MGKATIIPGGDPNSAYYRVNIDVDYESTLKEIEQLRRDQAVIDDTTIPGLYDSVEDSYKEHRKHQNHLQEMIKQEPTGTPDNVHAATLVANSKYSLYLNEKNKLDAALAKSASLQTKIDYLRGVTKINERNVWCADCTRNLSGTVATIEINGDDETILIHPGYNDGAEYSPSNHGRLKSINSMSPYGVFYNLCMLPAWQKWKPTYRTGIIRSIDNTAKTASITLDTVTMAHGLDITPEADFTKVPLTYKAQEDAAYQVDDHVVIEFIDQDYKRPQVIGFVQDPCTTTTTTASSTTSSTTSSGSTSSSSSTTTATPPPYVWFRVTLRQNTIDFGLSDLVWNENLSGAFSLIFKEKSGPEYGGTQIIAAEDLGGGDLKVTINSMSADPDGYWIFSSVDDATCPVSIQYPFYWALGDKLKDADLIQPYNDTPYDVEASYYNNVYSTSGIENALYPGESYIKYATVVSNLPYTITVRTTNYGGCDFPGGIWRCPFTISYPDVWNWPGKYCCTASEDYYADTIDCLPGAPSFQLWGDSKASRWEIRHSEDPGWVRVADDSYGSGLHTYQNVYDLENSVTGTAHNIIKLNAINAANRDWTNCYCPCGSPPAPGCPPSWVLCDECSGGTCVADHARRDNVEIFITAALNI